MKGMGAVLCSDASVHSLLLKVVVTVTTTVKKIFVLIIQSLPLLKVVSVVNTTF